MKVLKEFFPVIFGLSLILLSTSVFAQKVDTYNLDETYSISENGTLELRSDDAGLVEIIGSDRENVRVIVTYRLEVKGLTLGKIDEFEMEVTERNGNLYINERYVDTGWLNLKIGSSTRKYSITVLVPQSVNLDLYGDDDPYEISDMNGSIQIDADDSDIYLRDCLGRDFQIDFDDGDLIMDDGHGDLTMNFDDGEVDIRRSKFENVDVEFDDGDLNISTTLADNGNYNFSSDDGDIDLTILGGGGQFRINHADIRISADSDFQQTARNENFTTYDLSGGNTRVQINIDDGNVRLFTQ